MSSSDTISRKRDRSLHGSSSDSVDTIFNTTTPGTEGTFGESNANAVDVQGKLSLFLYKKEE